MPLEGIIPIIELLPCGQHWMVVMPRLLSIPVLNFMLFTHFLALLRWGECVHYPWFSDIRELVIFIRFALKVRSSFSSVPLLLIFLRKGLNSLHNNFIAHRVFRYSLVCDLLTFTHINIFRISNSVICL